VGDREGELGTDFSCVAIARGYRVFVGKTNALNSFHIQLFNLSSKAYSNAPSYFSVLASTDLKVGIGKEGYRSRVVAEGWRRACSISQISPPQQSLATF
jgi:hypothetical protein